MSRPAGDELVSIPVFRVVRNEICLAEHSGFESQRGSDSDTRHQARHILRQLLIEFDLRVGDAGEPDGVHAISEQFGELRCQPFDLLLNRHRRFLNSRRTFQFVECVTHLNPSFRR